MKAKKSRKKRKTMPKFNLDLSFIKSKIQIKKHKMSYFLNFFLPL